MKNLFERLAAVILVLAAAGVATAEIHREFWPHSTRPRSEYVDNWRSILEFSHVMGDSAAPITIIEFGDFQCPFCKRFDSLVASVQAKYSKRISVAFVHFPLPGHAQAEKAAKAAECISASRPFDIAMSALFSKQDSLGKRPWTEFALDAGIHDTASFLRCVDNPSVPRLLEAGRRIGERLKVRATPTILLNGWRYGGVPSDTEMIQAIDDTLKGKPPYKGFPPSALRLASGH
jgi:protein-disulfide isomerase